MVVRFCNNCGKPMRMVKIGKLNSVWVKGKLYEVWEVLCEKGHTMSVTTNGLNIVLIPAKKKKK